MARAGRDLGVAADECLSRDCAAALVELATSHPQVRVFVDSGAFSEVSDKAEHHAKAGLEPRPGQLQVVKPITEADWATRLRLMERVGKALGPRLLVMAPDKIADQTETLRRLRWFRSSGWLDRLRKTGAEIAVVLQGGELDPLAFDAAAAKALGWRGYAIAFPMMKGATPLALVRAFMDNRVTRRVHLLGVGPKSRKQKGRPGAGDIQRELFHRFPNVGWSWDSALIRASVGRTPGREAVYTAAQDLVRQELHAEALRGQIKFGRKGFALDWTDMAARPSLYLLDLWGWPKAAAQLKALRGTARTAETARGRAQWRKRKAAWDKVCRDFRARANRTARAAGLEGAELERFVADPDAFSQTPPDHPRIVFDPSYSHALETAFDQWTKMKAKQGGPPEIAELLAERATYLAFRPGGIPGAPGQPALPGFLEAV
jgi:hypothetical protein